MSSSKSERLYLFVPYIALVAIHLGFGIFREIPIIFADEIGYLGNARYMAGVAPMPNLNGCTFYHSGYSIFLIPAFHTGSDPISIYRVVMVINALLMSALYFPLYYVLHHLWNRASVQSMLIAFVTCLYPSYLIHANVAMSENAFVPLHAALIATCGWLLVRKSYLAAFTFGFLSAFLYTVHPRALPIAPLSILFLLFLWKWKFVPFPKAAIAAITCAVTIVATILLHRHLGTEGWGTSKTVVPFSASNMIRFIMSIHGLGKYFLLNAGHALYLVQASYGIFLLGGIYLVQLLRKKDNGEGAGLKEQKILLVFLILTSIIVTLALNVRISFSLDQRGFARTDHFIYGRYNEGLTAFYLALGLLASIDVYRNWRKRISVVALSAILLSILTITVHAGRGELSRRMNMVNITGTFPLMDLPSSPSLILVSLAAFILFALFIVLSGKRWPVAFLAVSVLFVAVAIFDYQFLVGKAERRMKTARLALKFAAKAPPINSICYDMSYYKSDDYFQYQYLLGMSQFQRFRSTTGEWPGCDVVISNLRWRQAKELNAKKVVRGGRNKKTIWVIPKRARLAKTNRIGWICG